VAIEKALPLVEPKKRGKEQKNLDLRSGHRTKILKSPGKEALIKKEGTVEARVGKRERTLAAGSLARVLSGTKHRGIGDRFLN